MTKGQLDFLKAGQSRERVVASRPHVNPDGERLKLGGATIIHCQPDCDAEFRSASDKSVIHDQLAEASWQVTLINAGDGKSAKRFRYRCPRHHDIKRGPMTGVAMPAGRKESKREREQRSSHDGGE